MAHFGVHKAKGRTLVALAAVAAIGGVVLSSAPAEAKNGETMQIGSFTIDMDGTMPEMVAGSGSDYFATYDHSYNLLEDGYLSNEGVYKLKENDYFGCTRRYTTLYINLKNEEAFKAFTTSDEDASKMIRVCEIASASHYAGTENETRILVKTGSANYNYLYVKEEMQTGFKIITDLDYISTGSYGFTANGIRVMSYENDGGKLALQVAYLNAGPANIDIYEPGREQAIPLDLEIADYTYHDSAGHVYYSEQGVYSPFRGTNEVRIDATYIGDEDLALGAYDVTTPEQIGLYLGASDDMATGTTGNSGPVGVDIEASFKTFNPDNAEILGGSKVRLTTALLKNIDIVDSELTLTSGCTQPGPDMVRLYARSGRSDETAKMIFEGGDYRNIEIMTAEDTEVVVEGGRYNQDNVAAPAETDSLFRIGSGGKVTINNGNFSQNTAVLPEDENEIWHNDTHALIHSYNAESITVNGGTFTSNGSIFSAEPSGSGSSEFVVNNGSFTGKHIIALANRWNGTVSINGGDFRSSDRFYVWDSMSDWECNQLPFTSQYLGDVARHCSTDGEETGRMWGTGVQGNLRVLVEPDKEQIVVTGGTFSDGYDSEDGSGVEPADNYGQAPLDSDYDRDGRKDVIVLPERVHDDITINFPLSMQFNVAPGSKIISIENQDKCSATIDRNGRLTITATEETLDGKYCIVRTSDSETVIDRFEVAVVDDTEWSEGAPMSIAKGETKTPEDLGGRELGDFELWGIVQGEEYCSVSDSGEITAIQGGGRCVVGAFDEDTNEIMIWLVTTTEPLELEIGESTKPSDLPEGVDPSEGTWSSDNTDVCTVSEDGTITGKKVGTCHVSFDLGEDGIYTWVVVIKENPNTLDRQMAINFSVAGALIGGLGAAAASIKRFGRR